MSQSPRASAGRFDALDTLRCLAVLVMVQGHTFYLVIEDAVRPERWYAWHNYIHGYTAPAFLFGAGLAFGVTTLRDLRAHGTWGPTLGNRVYRYLALFAIGYAIQLPPLGQDPVMWTEPHMRVFSRVEALQHIAAALLFCQGLVVLLRRKATLLSVVTLAGLALVALGPWVSRLPREALGPQPIAAYLTSDAGSTFPLVPWAGFVLLGVTVGALLPKSALRSANWRIAVGFCSAGLGLVGLSLLLDQLAPAAFGEHFYWKASPYFFLRRLGWVLVMLGCFSGLDCLLARATRTPGPVRRWVRLMSQQSLVAYVAHLALLYGSPFNRGVGIRFEGQLSVLDSTLLVLVMFAFLTALAAAWRMMERDWGATFLFVRRSSVTVMAILVVTAGVRAGGRTGTPMMVQASPQQAPEQLQATVAPSRAAPSETSVSLPAIVIESALATEPELGVGVEVATPVVAATSVAAATVLR